VQITASAALAIPPDDPYLEGRVDDLKVSFKPNGIPEEFTLRGVGMTIQGFDIPPIDDLGGQVYIGGLDNPSKIFFAGRVGGSYEGYKVKLLVAFNMAGPIGACIDFNAGGAGIPIDGGYLGGVLLSGASGGISLVNSNGDPCDFTTYLDSEGRPKSSLVSLPESPMSWSQLRDHAKRFTERQTVFGSLPPLPARAGNIPGRGDIALSSVSNSSVSGQPAQSGDHSSGSGVSLQSAGGTTGAFGIPCPGDCPPATINIFCQPHPDQVRFPNRVIAKFSSIDEATLNNILQITPQNIANLGSNPAQIATNVARRIRLLVDTVIPKPDTTLLGAAKAAQVLDLITQSLDMLESAFAGGALSF
jgi:hypothetical protein